MDMENSNSITAGTSPASSGALSPGDTLTIPQFTYDAQGHVTAVTSSQCTLPAGAGQGSVTDVAAGVICASRAQYASNKGTCGRRNRAFSVIDDENILFRNGVHLFL